MKRLFPFLAFVLLLPALAGAQQVTFNMQVPQEGTTRAIVDSMELVFLISVNAEGADQSFDMTQAKRQAYTETILAADDQRILKRKVSYTDATERGNQPMQGLKTVSLPVSGKSYILEYIADSLAITAEDGATVSKEERGALEGTFRRNTDGQFSSILNGRTMSVGEEIELTAEMLDQFGAGLTAGPMKLNSAKIKLVNVHDVQGMLAALLDVSVVMIGTQGTMEMEFAMNGTAEIGVENLWPLSFVMKGTVTGAGNHAGMDLTADGDMRMARTATYK
ncbi:MAG: hypothetical protein IH600_08540 [Bacteroidetes bacterium]|nr:hypothetical protein [Bacteroidota bacterium]